LRILVFEAGRTTGAGTPAELAATYAGYQRMSKLQRLE
jgi:ABC-type multidrug transport system fused ATPase/permease subunit